VSKRASRLAKLTSIAALATLACGRSGDAAPGAKGSDSDPLRAELSAEAAAPAAPGDWPATAKPELLRAMRESLSAKRHPADGGGRAWLSEASPTPLRAGQQARVTLVYEAGPLGVASGGAVFLQVSPFWGWSTPQTEDPAAPGFTTVTASAPDLELEARAVDQQLLAIQLRGRPLRAGERITLVYGAGEAMARADRYAERGSRFWFAVDGDGDGARAVLEDSPSIDVSAGPAAQLRVTLPSSVHAGETFRVAVALLDAVGNAGVAESGELRFDSIPAGLELPARAEIASGSGGVIALEGVARKDGVYRLAAVGPGGLRARSNPMEVGPGPRVLWADLHGHSGLSDGSGQPDDYYRYARDAAGLDVAVLTDHDHWGMLPLATHPALFDEILASTERFHAPGSFVTIPGWEWTSWIHGHRHVLHFEGKAAIKSSVDPAFESPPQLWKALEGTRALTFAHHSAGGSIATNWEIAPDPRFEPVTEIVSVQGSSESPDGPLPIYDPVSGNYVRDALSRGYRLGFVGSGDSHDGHPGLAQLASGGSGGLAAIIAEDKTRDAVYAALMQRRCYATNGPRILLRAAIGGRPMGATLRASELGDHSVLYLRALAPAPLDRFEIVRSGERLALSLDHQDDIELHYPIEKLRAGEWIYVRVVQEDGGAAWSSPVFVE
jgi:hypothetical protein